MCGFYIPHTNSIVRLESQHSSAITIRPTSNSSRCLAKIQRSLLFRPPPPPPHTHTHTHTPTVVVPGSFSTKKKSTRKITGFFVARYTLLNLKNFGLPIEVAVQGEGYPTGNDCQAWAASGNKHPTVSAHPL